MTIQEITPASTMRNIYSEEYRLLDRDFRIIAFRDKGKITVKIYEVVRGRVTVIPQFEVSLQVDFDEELDISRSPMFQKIINASKLFLRNFQ